AAAPRSPELIAVMHGRARDECDDTKRNAAYLELRLTVDCLKFSTPDLVPQAKERPAIRDQRDEHCDPLPAIEKAQGDQLCFCPRHRDSRHGRAVRLQLGSAAASATPHAAARHPFPLGHPHNAPASTSIPAYSPSPHPFSRCT